MRLRWRADVLAIAAAVACAGIVRGVIDNYRPWTDTFSTFVIEAAQEYACSSRCSCR